MPIALIALSVLLQAGTEGFLSGRLDVTSSLLFSLLAFVSSAAVFLLMSVLRGCRRPPAPRRPVRRLLWRMNIASAVTFLGFYLSLVWVPAALAASLMAGVGPLAVALIDTVRRTGAPGRASWARGGTLLAVSLLAALACVPPGELSRTGPTTVGGGALAVAAGFGAAYLAMVSRSLGTLGVDPVLVMAHRFHLTYAVAALLLLSRGGPGGQEMAFGAAAVAGLLGVVLPLYLLQIGIQRCPPMVTMVLLTTLPGLTYVAQVLFGDTFRPLSAVMITAMIALALLFARIEQRSRPVLRAAPAGAPKPVAAPPRRAGRG
ncbi:hypothetical protein [Streptomyces barkulensis]|uniref:hypothetical protein n=1 Tax=Streptomyces barkulensis TaxID=1257026 RepID=UPI000C6D5B38|nr:hypothetical protein [Streptomyces barkulensis]